MRPRDRLHELHKRCAGTEPSEPAGTMRGPGLARVEGDGECGVYGATTEPLLPSAGDAGAAGALAELIDEVERVRCWVRDLERNTALARALHADPAFHASKQLQDQLDAVVTESNALALKVSGALRQMQARAEAEAAGEGEGAAGAGAVRRARVLQARCWRRLYAEALRRHHAALSELHEDQLLLLRRQLNLTNPALTDEECESLLDANNVALFVDNVRAETAEARRALREVEARHDELLRVEGALADLHQLFQQLAHLVAAQQEQVDTVEYYALAAGECVQGGGRQLRQGAAGKKRARRKKISIVLCIAAGSLVVLLVLVLT